MNNTTRLESDLAWFLEKFKDSEDWISARDIARRYVRKAGQEGPDAKYFRGLMTLAVGETKATPNEYPHTHTKYRIRLVAHKSIDRFFDREVLLDPLIIDLPPRKYLKVDLTSEQLSHWNAIKSLWILIYKAFCRHQNGLGIEDFSKEWSSDFFNSREGVELSKRISVKAYFFICTYKLLQLGWQEIEKEIPDISQRLLTYNGAFLVLLRFNSIASFRQCFKDTSYRPRSMYEYLREILHEARPALKAEAAMEVDSVSEEIRQRNRERTQRLGRLSGAPTEGSTDAILFDLATGVWIEEALKNSTNPEVQEALRIWREAEVAISEQTLRELNYERNLPKSDED